MLPPSDRRREERNGKTREQPTLDIFADSNTSKPREPSRPRESRRARRNSDSSLMERPGKALDPEDEKRRRERRHREREARHRDRDGKHRTKGKIPSRRLDAIDKLDVTSIYGTGRKILSAFLLLF